MAPRNNTTMSMPPNTPAATLTTPPSLTPPTPTPPGEDHGGTLGKGRGRVRRGQLPRRPCRPAHLVRRNRGKGGCGGPHALARVGLHGGKKHLSTRAARGGRGDGSVVSPCVPLTAGVSTAPAPRAVPREPKLLQRRCFVCVCLARPCCLCCCRWTELRVSLEGSACGKS